MPDEVVGAMQPDRVVRTDVAVVGGGPAGMVLALLLARQGVDVTVLEKHGDFLRDFRGDTVHPSTVATLDEVGLGEALLALPHRKVRRFQATFDDGTVTVVDFSRLRVPHPYVVFLPQWDLLNLLAEHGSRLPGFTLLHRAEVTDVVREGLAVRGVRAQTPDGPLELRARLVVAADGRDSTVRTALRLRPRSFGAPMDVLWFRLSRTDDDPSGLQLRVAAGRVLLMIDRGDYWQVAAVIRKGSLDRVRARGLPAFRDSVAELVPWVAGRTGEVGSWDDVKVLTVTVDRLRRWDVPGALLIGDAAHAMSPIGGVGINLAVQDAVATARLLGPRLRDGDDLPQQVLRQVARRRWLPTVLTQTVQLVVQRRVLAGVLQASDSVRVPRLLRVVQRVPALTWLPARLVGIGVRPEHVAPRRRERWRERRPTRPTSTARGGVSGPPPPPAR